MLLKNKIEGKKKWKFESRKENQLSSNTLVPGSINNESPELYDRIYWGPYLDHVY